MKKGRVLKAVCHGIGVLLKVALIFVAVTGTIYWFNLENKLLYYVVRPFLNKHYDAQKRDRRV